MTMRTGFLAMAAAAAMLVACGGASESSEEIAGGVSRLDGKDPGTKDPNAPCDKPGAPTDPKDPNAGSCFTLVEGDKTSCKSASDWKTYANDVCTAKGAALTALGLGDTCGTAKDSYTFVKFECCLPTAGGDPGTKEPPKDPNPKDPSDPGAGTACTGEYLNNACQSEADWKSAASQVCAKSGLALTDLGYGAVCGKNGEIGEVKFTCCK